MAIRFDGKVAIVTGAGGGLGREHALALAARGAKVVVNDLGGARDGTGGSSAAAEAVVAEIVAAGGEAMANGASVTDAEAVQAMVDAAVAKWGSVDILVNNAGILRDKSFAKMTLEDFRLVMDVHVMGAVHCTKAVWDIMRQQNYGRVVMTTSSSGLYGNFGQSNYGAAKMALVGLMQTLSLEGEGTSLLYRGGDGTGKGKREIAEVLRLLVQSGIEFEGVETSESTLEDIFVDLVENGAETAA